MSPLLLLVGLLNSTSCTLAFSPATSSSRTLQRCGSATTTTGGVGGGGSTLRMSDADEASSPTRERIQSLVEANPVLLFMKGTKLFPQCGFSNTACQILQSYGIDFHTVDVLADDEIRQGIKTFSQWPTIPQLYVCGEFIGGSDIMIEMYQSG
jgi:monothiol glutaredoxin